MSTSSKRRRLRRLAVGAGAFVLALAGVALGSIAYLMSDLPSITSLNDYQPAQSTRIYSDDGHLIGELYDERRRVAPIEAIPQHVIHAFLSAEDAGFYEHEGLDYWGIARAAIKNLRPGAHLQGASTITQQTVKTLVIGAERSYARKMREALLTRALEQMLSKDDILYLYLNQIYFGAGAYGVEEAARTYFGKSVRDVTLGEAAYLAAAPKNPSRYTLHADPKAAKERHTYVLQQMVANGWADAKAAQEAIAAPIPAPAPPPPYLRKTPHYVEHVRRLLLERYGDEHDEHDIARGGWTVYTGMNAEMQIAAQKALRLGLEEIAQKHGWPGAELRVEVDRYDPSLQALREEYRESVENRLVYSDPHILWLWDLHDVGARSLSDERLLRQAMELVPFAEDLVLTGVVSKVDTASKDTFVDLGGAYARLAFTDLEWARPFEPVGGTKAPTNPTELFRRGDLVAVALAGAPNGRYDEKPLIAATLVPRPMAEGALVAIDPYTRHVRAMVGGYHQGSGDLIRAVQSRRQPGSAFKPILYTAALQEKAITPASICPDSPVVIRDPWTGKSWKPENDDGTFDGNITYRQALTRSKNTCSVKLIDRVGVEPVLALAEKLGIHSELPKNLTLALGTGELTPLELANAYATIASGGGYAEPIFIRKVVDGEGTILEEHRAVLEQQIDPAAAYVVGQMMRSVVEEGTATRAKVLDRVVAGKTGTSQQSRDAWFAGFSAELVAGVWIGFDDNSPLGRVYGGSGALPVWIRFMGRALAGVPTRELTPPQDVVTVRVDRRTGEPTSNTDEATTMEEVFIAGTEPDETTQPLVNPFLLDDEVGGEPL